MFIKNVCTYTHINIYTYIHIYTHTSVRTFVSYKFASGVWYLTESLPSEATFYFLIIVSF